MTDWESRYRQGDTPWEKGGPAPPLAELLERHGSGIFGAGPVWVPGCGSGHDVRLLAAHGLEVLGIDIAPSAIRLAHTHSQVGTESYALLDFLDPDIRLQSRASAIWEHTCFCAIDPADRAAYAASAAALLEKGGVLAGVFFLTPHDPGDDHSGPPHAATIEEIDACFAPWFERLEAWVPQRAYPGREGREWLAIYKRFTPPGDKS